MGQYYKAVFLVENQKPITSVSSYDFGNGAKLMEHSWEKNPFVRFVERQLMVAPQKVVWAGDYADHEDPKTITAREIKLLADEESEYWNSKVLKEKGVNLYSLSETIGKLTHDENNKNKYEHDYKEVAPLTAKYLVNHDKKEFVNKTKTPKDGNGWKIHPLPLLTCEGNGRGGGDFHINTEKKQGNVELIGTWARDRISVVSTKAEIPKDFTELVFDLVEI
jgi:hypothetical protein